MGTIAPAALVAMLLGPALAVAAALVRAAAMALTIAATERTTDSSPLIEVVVLGAAAELTN
jgi:hypothetical protein